MKRAGVVAARDAGAGRRTKRWLSRTLQAIGHAAVGAGKNAHVPRVHDVGASVDDVGRDVRSDVVRRVHGSGLWLEHVDNSVTAPSRAEKCEQAKADPPSRRYREL